MFRVQSVFFLGILALSSGSVNAHHSRASYDMASEIVIEGIVVDLAWKNPHIFMTVETEDERGETARVEIEVASVSEARTLGLTRDVIAPAERVLVRAHPGRRDPTKAVGLYVMTSDGAIYPLNTESQVSIRAKAVEATGIAGHWAPTLESFNGFFPTLESWPITESGRAIIAEGMARVNSESIAFLGICEPFPPPTLSIFPDIRTIEVNDSTVVMHFEGGVGVAMERVIYLNQSDHPADIAPSLMGHSIGSWEDDALVVDTVGFSPHPVGAILVPSGPRKHLIERFELTEDRLRLEYTFTFDDPELVVEPVSYTALWDHRPDMELSGEVCDPEIAQRPLK